MKSFLICAIALISVFYLGCEKHSLTPPPPTFTITYSGNGNSGGNVPIDSKSYLKGASVVVLDNTGSLVKSGFRFAGWNLSPDGTGTNYSPGNSFSIGSSNMTLYANWLALPPPTYAVTYNGNGNTGGTVPVDSKTYVNGAPVVVLDNTGNLVKSGFRFSGWNLKPDGTGTNYSVGNSFSMSSSNIALYASWLAVPPQSYSVAYSGNGSTSGSVPIDTKTYVSGSSVVVLDNTGSLVKSGSYFSGWNLNADGTGINYTAGNSFAIGSSNVTLYADWVASASEWSPSTLPNSNRWISVAEGNNTFVALAYNTNVAAYSIDAGKTWTSTNLPISSTWTCVVYGANKFLAITDEAGICATSPDGITWTQGAMPRGDGGAFEALIFENNQFVALGTNSKQCITSPDGITWAWNKDALPSPSYWTSIAYGNNTYVTTAGTTAVAATSPDGITWTSQSVPSTLSSLAFGNGVFVGVPSGGNASATSSDGITWTPHTLPYSGEQWSITFGNGIFVAIEYNSTNVVTSVDGISWKTFKLPNSTTWQSIAYGDGNFVALSILNNASAYSK